MRSDLWRFTLIFARRTILLALSLFASMCFAQTGARELGYLHLQSWSTEEGLPQSSVHSIVQTHDGYIWAATEGGLARFDGLAFKTFNRATVPAILSDDICCLVEDSSNALWIGSADGLLRMQDGVFQRFGEANGLPSSFISSLVSMADGSVLALTANGLAIGDRNQFHLLPQPTQTGSKAISKILAIGPANDGGAWLVSATEILHFSSGTASAHACGALEDLSLVTGIAEGHDGSIWLRSAGDVTVCSGSSMQRWSVGASLPGARVESLSLDRHDTAWIGTNDGLASLSSRSSSASPIATLRGNAVLHTLEDSEGNLWIGTETSGLQVLRHLKFRTESLLANEALTGLVQTSDGAIWIGTRQDGVRRLRGNKVEEPVPSNKLTSPVVLSLAPGEDGSVWVGTPDGLNHIKADGAVQKLTSADGLPDDLIRSLLTDRDGSIWVGTRRGVSHLRGSNISTLGKLDGLGGDLIGSLLQTSGGTREVWVGTSGGLSRIRSDGSITNFTRKDGLPNDIVTAMVEDSLGTLWVATRDGNLSRFANGKFKALRSTPASGEIAGMAADAQGFLWLRVARGVRRVALASLNRCADDSSRCQLSIASYGTADGMPSEELVAGASPAVWRTRTGELWFPTRRGVAIADPEHLPINIVAPQVAMQRFLVDEVPIDLSKQPIQINFGHARFTMDFAALTYTVPPEVRYRFMLDGFDRTWTEAGSRRTATYTNLPPRQYDFRVQAMNNDGLWSAPQTQLRFRIIPPFYRRWWFALLVVLCAVVAFAALYQLRLRRLQRQFEAVLGERNRIAREIHDTLAQDFVGVSIQLDLVSQLIGATRIDAAMEQIRQTRKLVTQGLADARRSIWELRANTAKESLPTLLAKVVKRYTTGDTPMQLHVGGAYRSLNAETEAEVLRIAQEALSNVQRHSNATEVSVDLRYGRDMLELTILDNGEGFMPQDARHMEGHYGLRGMRERAALLGAQLAIASERGQGAKLTLSLPMTVEESRT